MLIGTNKALARLTRTTALLLAVALSAACGEDDSDSDGSGTRVSPSSRAGNASAGRGGKGGAAAKGGTVEAGKDGSSQSDGGSKAGRGGVGGAGKGGSGGAGKGGGGGAGKGGSGGSGKGGSGGAGKGGRAAAGKGGSPSGDAGSDGKWTDPPACVACETKPPTTEPNDCVVARMNCTEMMGRAAAGPLVGEKLSVLCANALSCMHTTGCAYESVPGTATSSDCFCGKGMDAQACEMQPLASLTGACKDELLAAAELTSADGIITKRFYDTSFASGAAIALLETCDDFYCQVCQPVSQGSAENGGSGGTAGSGGVAAGSGGAAGSTN